MASPFLKIKILYVMKKLLFTFIISVLALDMSAQIQRTFLGNVLAVSTYEEVRTNMRNKGYGISALINKDCAVYSDVKFAGYNCEEAYFNFIDNKFSMVTFIFEETSIKDTDRFNSLKEKLISKYPDFKHEEKEDVVLFYDNSTFLSLRNEISDSTSKYVLSISYWDFNLTKEKLLNDMNKRNSYDEL